MFTSKKLSLRNVALALMLLVAACDGEGCGSCDNSSADPAPDTPAGNGCISGYVKNASGSCVKQCPEHQHADGASCAWDTRPVCASGFRFDDNVWNCIQNTPGSPSGPNNGCPGNSYLDNGKCLCPVNTGWNGVSCVAPTNPGTQCPSGYYLSGNTCVPNKGGGNPNPGGFPPGVVTTFELDSNDGSTGDCFMQTANRSASVWGVVNLIPSDYGTGANGGISIGCRSNGLSFESNGYGQLWQCGLAQLGCGNAPSGQCVVQKFSTNTCLLRTEGGSFGDPAYDPASGQKTGIYFIGLPNCGNNCN